MKSVSWPVDSISCGVCLCVCAAKKPMSKNFLCFEFFFWVLGSVQTSLQRIMKVLAGGGLVALAFSVSFK